MIAFVIKRSASNIIKRFGHAITSKRQSRSVALTKTPCKWADGFYIYIKTRPSYLIRFIKASSDGEYNCHTYLIFLSSKDSPFSMSAPRSFSWNNTITSRWVNSRMLEPSRNIPSLSILKLRWSSKWLNRTLDPMPKPGIKASIIRALVHSWENFRAIWFRQQTKMTRSQFLGISAYSHVSFPLLGCIW